MSKYLQVDIFGSYIYFEVQNLYNLYNPNEHFENIKIRMSIVNSKCNVNSNRIPLKVCIKIDLDSKIQILKIQISILLNNSL